MAYFAFLRGFGDCAKIIHSLTHSFNYDGNECLGAGHVLGILDEAVDKRDKSPRLQGAYILVGDSGNKQISKTHVVSLGHKQEGKEWRREGPREGPWWWGVVHGVAILMEKVSAFVKYI